MDLEKNDKLLICFIGAGNIAQSLAKGFLKSGYVEPQQIYASAPSDKNLHIFKQLGCNVNHKNIDLLSDDCGNDSSKSLFLKIIFLCVKPNLLKSSSFVKEMDDFLDIPYVKYNASFISVLAGVSMSTLLETFKNLQYFRCARIMPNTACSIGSGVIGLYWNNSNKKEQLTLVSTVECLLSKLGHLEIVDNEKQLNSITGTSGSGIAFVYTMIQAMADGGVLVGLTRQQSLNVTLETIMGACKMVKETKQNPIDLRDKVCSPAGTTIQGVHALERGQLNSTIMDAIKAAYDRSKEFENELSK